MFTPYRVRGADAARTASWSRRWRSTRRSTALPATSTSCISARARMGGAGCVFTEMTCPSPDARITPGLPGPVERRADARLEAHRRLRCTRNSDAQIGLQLGPRRRARARRAAPGTASTCRFPMAAARQLAADLGLAPALPAGRRPDAARHDPRRHGPRHSATSSPRRDARRRRRASTGWSCTAPTAICCRASSRR